MGFINFRGGLKEDNYAVLSEQAKQAEEAEQERLGSKRRRSIAADYFSVPEMAEADNKTVLAQLVRKYNSLAEQYQTISDGNPLGSIFDEKQFMNDFWMSSLASILDQGDLEVVQKIKCLHLLLAAFRIEKQTMAKDYYLFMEKNDRYKGYVERCFVTLDEQIPLIWKWMHFLGSQPLPDMGKHESNRMNMVTMYVEEYISFMMLCSFYISQLFPGHGCGKDTRANMEALIDRVAAEFTDGAVQNLSLADMINPAYANPDDYRQSVNSSENKVSFAKAFARLKRKLGKQSRVLMLVRLLDQCSDSESKVLENEYKRAVKGL